MLHTLKKIDVIFLNSDYFDADVERIVDSIFNFDFVEQFFNTFQLEYPLVLEI